MNSAVILSQLGGDIIRSGQRYIQAWLSLVEINQDCALIGEIIMGGFHARKGSTVLEQLFDTIALNDDINAKSHISFRLSLWPNGPFIQRILETER